MEIKYIVKSQTQPHLYLVADTTLGNRKVPYAFKQCLQVIYEVAIFNSKEDALVACEEAAKYCSISHYFPVILEIICQNE